jgi:5-methylcytosine-specific restriction endonuclease McrA
MNAPTGKLKANFDLAGCQHWSSEMPYRALVPVNLQNPNGPVLYQVAGLNDPACGALKALKLALTKHGGKCFYCAKSSATETSINFTLDHIEAKALGGKDDISNLVVACKPCNSAKGQGVIDSFNPQATREWLSALQKQIAGRLQRLPAGSKS